MKLTKIFLTLLCLFSLVACGKKEEAVQANKDGTLYEVENDISFYYPNDFELTPKTEDEDENNIIYFQKENQVLFYQAKENTYDNDLDQEPELYRGELETNQAQNIEVKEPVLESGLKCYEYSGKYKQTGLQFTYLVYFDENYTYIYGYEANENEYVENIEDIIVYLETFSKNTGL